MIVYTAIIKDGVVIDTERWDDANPPEQHPSKIARVAAPDYVVPGFRHNGTTYLMPDGSPIAKELTDADTEAKDRDDILTRLLSIRSLIADVRQGSGSNLDRIKRIEDVLAPVARAVIKLYR